ncbi:MAG: YdcF family protein [Janthinobacterium lividum]
MRAAGFGALVWLGGFAWFVATRPGAAPLALTTDAVVVLTGGSGRLARGVQVIEQGSATRMLISGVGPRVRKPQLAATVAAPLRLFAASVDLGFSAVDTRSNAVETAAWMARHRYRSLRLVTSTSHMRRAELELEAHLPPDIRIVADAVPAETGADSLAKEFTKYALRAAALAFGAA